MATIKEVAKRAHVSIATVSYVLNGTGSVSAGKRLAVLEAAAALNYRPSYRGRALQAQRSMTLGLVLPATIQRVAEPSFGELLAGMTEGAARCGYHILLASSTAEQSEAGMYNQLFRSGRVDGVIILDTTSDDSRITAACSEDIPYICAGRPSDNSPFVAIDGLAGMLEVMAHLIVRGHERIGLLHSSLEQSLVAEQDAGYGEALAESGLPFDPSLIVEGGQSEAEGYAATEELLALPEPPTALVAGTSALAFGALHAIHDQRRSVGRDIALVSFEDTPAAAHTAPPLTALRQPLRQWGQALAAELIEIINQHTHPQLILPPQLIVRRSCGE
jgi:LacI family transcriptional regulator/LacI family repressor for deo operon, udp, cdd, tsx, nupC, and nupG